MTCFIHLLRLKMIESEIQHKVYRVDNAKSPKTIYETTDRFLERLTAWKDAIPPQSNLWDSTNPKNFKGDEYRRYDSYVSE